MGLNPGSRGAEVAERVLSTLFNGGSPYFDMFTAGKCGVRLEDAVAKCAANGIAVRAKDVENWENGQFAWQMGQGLPAERRQRQVTETGIDFDQSSISDFPRLPAGWTGCKRRFFSCTKDNRPMQKWGWSRDYQPHLYEYADARALSPCGWVGQNMMYQRFIVMDIDGRGHGADDDQVIAFGSMFRDTTMCMEDPSKPGSFHLYFSTDRIIPIKHFGWAKLDLMGNADNAAVYLKDKVSNGLPMRELDDSIWNALMEYQRGRKERI